PGARAGAGRRRGGTPTALARTTTADLREFHRTRYTVDNAFLVVVGDTTRAEVEALLGKHLAAFPRRPAGFRAPTWKEPSPRAAAPEIVLVDRPGAAQSVVAAVAPAPLTLVPLDGPTEAMNTLLGGSFMSRLNQNLREDKQYAYGARSAFDLRPGANVFVASTSVATPVTAPGLVEVRRELERIRTYIEDNESQRAAGYRALTFPAAFETGGAVASRWAWAHLRGVSDASVTSFPERVLSTTPRSMLDAARKNLALQGLRFVVVGDGAAIGDELRKLHLGDVRELHPDVLLPPAPPAPSATRR
ncbi:MAG: M16 family metallopeptidase, partial [Myxococcota bacterium]